MDLNLNDLVKKYQGLLSNAGNTLSSLQPKVQQLAQPILKQPITNFTPFRAIPSPTVGQVGQKLLSTIQTFPQRHAEAQRVIKSPQNPEERRLAGQYVSQMIPLGGISKAVFSKSQVNLARNLEPQARDMIGRFAQLVEQGKGRNQLGQTGDYVYSVGETIFGKGAANMSSKQLKNSFDILLEQVDKAGGRFQMPRIGLSTQNVRQATKGVEVKVVPITKELEPLAQEARKGIPVRRFEYGKKRFPAGAQDKFEPTGVYYGYHPSERIPELPHGAKSVKLSSLSFENPKLVPFENWKSNLSKEYGGLKGEALSKELAKQGYDGVIAYAPDNMPAEIVSLKDFYTQATKGVGGVERTYRIIKEEGIREVKGTPVKIVDGLDTFIHEGTGGWVISESSTGRYIADSRTKEGVIAKANFVISDVGKEKLKQTLLKYKLPKPQGVGGEQVMKVYSEKGLPIAKQKMIERGDEIISTTKRVDNRGDTVYNIKYQPSGVGGVRGVKEVPGGLRQFPKPPQGKIEQIPELKTQVSGKVDQTLLPKQILSSSEKLIPQGMKERKFIKTVREAKVTKKDVAEQVEGFYTPMANKDLISKATFTVKTDYDFAKQRVIKEPLSAETNAMGQEIMRQAQNAGRFDEAIEMAELLSQKGTEAGQSVQAFANWARLTPQGMLRYAQREFLSANEKMGQLSKIIRRGLGKQEAKFTAEDAKVITDLMTKANKTPDEALRAQYIKETFEYIGKKLPWGVSDVIDSYRYNNMLSNPLTHLRNAVNNLQQVALIRPATLTAEGRPLEAIKYEFAALKSLPDAMVNFVKSIKSSQTFGKMDIVKDVSQMQVIKPNRIGFLNIPSKAMEASDQFFRTLVKAGERARGASSEAAEKMADYSLFRAELNPQQQGFVLNKIDDITKAVYQLRKVGLGWFIPFIRTPMNVAKQWIEYSPMGIATLSGAGNKREQLAKTLLGSMVTMIGANIALEDRTTWAAPTDHKQKELFYASGRKPYSVKIGDKWVPLQTFGVFSWALGLPAAFKYYNDESRTALTDSNLEKLAKSLLSLGGFWSNQTFVSGLSSFIKVAEGDADYTVPKNIAFTLGQLKPWEGLMRYVSTVIDPIYRKPSGFSQQLQADIPIVTKGLPAYENPMGEPSKRNITNYVAPYAAGQEDKFYEEPYQLRTEKLQQNAVINKMKKDIETQLNQESMMGAQAAEEAINPHEAMRQKFQLDLAKSRVELKGGMETIGNTIIYNDGTSVKTLNLSPVEKPNLTGNTELDKIKTSSYNSSISTLMRNIVKAQELGVFTPEEAEKKIKELSEMKVTKPKKPKRITLRKITFPKVKIPKVSVKKIKIPKPKRVKRYSLKTKKVKSAKVKLSQKLT